MSIDDANAAGCAASAPFSGIISGWNWSSFDEFHGYNGDCMEYALEMCLSAINHRSPLVNNMNHLVQAFQQRGWAGSNGATTINACIAYVQQEGYTLTPGACYGYTEPARFDLAAILSEHAGKLPILLNLAEGHNLTDDWTHQADEANLHYHGIAVLGVTPNGNYACADGDNPASEHGRYEMYSLSQILSAKPCGVLVFSK